MTASGSEIDSSALLNQTTKWVIQELRDRSLTVAVMESATGGAISKPSAQPLIARDSQISVSLQAAARAAAFVAACSELASEVLSP